VIGHRANPAGSCLDRDAIAAMNLSTKATIGCLASLLLAAGCKPGSSVSAYCGSFLVLRDGRAPQTCPRRVLVSTSDESDLAGGGNGLAGALAGVAGDLWGAVARRY